jgi:hypothetical protein
MTTRPLVLVASILMLGGVAISIGRGTQLRSNQLSSSDALQLMRIIGTVEATSYSSEGRYIPLQGIPEHRSVRKNLINISLNDSYSGTIKNYKVSVVVATDGKHFEAALVPSEGCGPALFSDESSLIYQGQVLGCPGR